MTEMLQRGEQLRTVTGAGATVEELLGAGAQGEVYRGRLYGDPIAIKWYYPSSATAQQWTTLAGLIERQAPSDRFLWPIDLVRALRGHEQEFGYVMALRGPQFKGISDLLRRSVRPRFRELATAAMQLADGFLQLHGGGLCYRDISQGNVFFDPSTGDVLVCDNDNVGLPGQAADVLGTPRYMAPEIVRGESLPSTQTDLFSLAVLLFLMLVNHHPLDGAQEYKIHSLDRISMNKLYGTSPVFIFDPIDESNRPVTGYHDNALRLWWLYPQYLRDLFTRAFTDGIRDPVHGRVRETEWREAMGRLRDSIVYCGSCGREATADGDGQVTCWGCHAAVLLPPRIRIGRWTVMLSHRARLFPYHIAAERFDFTTPIAEMTQHPQTPDLWGLKNLSGATWSYTTSEGTVRELGPGRSVGIRTGLRIDFGKVEGEIVA